jgi:hypothetical protein
MGRPRQPGGLHAEGRCARVWVGLGHGVGNDPITPTLHTPEAWLERRPRVPPAQPGGRPGALGENHPELPAASLQKHQAGESRTPSHQPHWGFLFSITSACAGREGEGNAPPPRRAGEGRTRASQERGAGAEEDDRRRGHLPCLRTPLHRAGHDYIAAPP